MGNSNTYKRVTDPRDPLTITNNTDCTIQTAIRCVHVNPPVDGFKTSSWYNSCYTLAVGESVTIEVLVNYPVHLKISGGISRFMVTNLKINLTSVGQTISITEGDKNFVLTEAARIDRRSSEYLYHHCVPCSCCACGIGYCCRLPLPCCIMCMCAPDVYEDESTD